MKHRGTALITGGAKRIGEEISMALSQLGFYIALHYNQSEKEAKEVKKNIEAIGGRCELFPCDLAEVKATESLIKSVQKKFSDFTLLINNASIFEKSSLKKASAKSFDDHLNINLRAPFILMRDFAKSTKEGHIINIIDTNVTKSETNHLTYLLSKKALFDLTKMAAFELAPDIRVNAVAPGLILPPVDAGKRHVKRLTQKIPMKQKGEVSHVTQTIAFLIDNPFVTGQIIYNDGGEHLL